MARCKLTRMSLRNIRKDKQYQCIVIDFVRTGVIGKSKAEELLGYTIPAGLLQGSVTEPTEEEPSGNEYSGNNDYSGNESGNEYSGNNDYSGNSPTSTKFTVVYNPGNSDSNSHWGEMELDMSDLADDWENNGIVGNVYTNTEATLDSIKTALANKGWFPQLGSGNGTVKNCNALRIVQLNPDAVLSNNYYSARKYIATGDSIINPGDIVEIYVDNGYSGNNSYSGC